MNFIGRSTVHDRKTVVCVTYLSSGLIESASPRPGDIKCGWKNRLSVWPKELFILGAEPLRWLNGSNMFVWLLGLKLLSELSGMFTGADVPWRRPIQIMGNKRKSIDVETLTMYVPDIELEICEFGMFTGWEEFCSSPEEARPADIEFSRWPKSFAVTMKDIVLNRNIATQYDCTLTIFVQRTHVLL